MSTVPRQGFRKKSLVFRKLALESRLPLADDEKQYRTPNVSVGTWKKSVAAIASRWLVRNVSHRFT
jgi:hypothetical protein